MSENEETLSLGQSSLLLCLLLFFFLQKR